MSRECLLVELVNHYNIRGAENLFHAFTRSYQYRNCSTESKWLIRIYLHLLLISNITKTLWKARWLFGKTKWFFRKLDWHPGKTGILTNMDNTMKEKCPQGVCSGEGEYITHLTCSYGNDLDMHPAITCDCGRKFNSLRGSRITRRAGAKNVILLPENVNRMMGLWIRFTPTVFTSPLLTVTVLETFFASQEFSGPRVIR